MSSPKETRTPDFLALNHRGKTPVFVDPTIADDGAAPEKPIIVMREGKYYFALPFFIINN